MTDVDRADPLEIRVLETLTSGPLSAAEVAMRVWESEPVVTPVLERSVVEENVTRLKLGKRAAYSLTPKGLLTLGVFQGQQGAVDGDAHADLGVATRMVMEQYDAARDVAVEDAVREQSGWAIADADRERVTSGLDDAFARGALTKEQLDDRTSRALTATTMADLRAAGGGVTELSPMLPTGPVNPALRKVQWRHVLYAALYVILGVFLLLALHSAVGVASILVGLGLGAWTLRPLFAGGGR